MKIKIKGTLPDKFRGKKIRITGRFGTGGFPAGRALPMPGKRIKRGTPTSRIAKL